jgi:hypothetical protein
VPFETPAVYASRVRADERDGMCLLLRNFATNHSTYVLPWKAVPSTLPMSPRDRALHHEVGATGALTPRAMRAAVRTVAASGLGGPAAAAAVKQALADERYRAAELQAALLLRAMAGCGLPAGTAPPRAMTAASVPEALRVVAAALRISPSELFATTGMIAHELLPVGLRPALHDGTADGGGPLRHLLTQLSGFSRHLRDRIDSAPPEARAHYERASAAAEATILRTDAVLDRIDHELGDMRLLLTAWPVRRVVLRRELDQLYWLLDGWEPTIEHYTKKLTDWLTLSQDRTLAILSTLMPPAAASPEWR